MSRFPFMDEREERDLDEAVRRAARTRSLPKKFYQRAEPAAEEGGFVLTLDGRGARTPARNPLQVPNRALADAVAAEWNGQGAEIDPDTMPYTRIVNSAIDAVGARRPEVIDDLVRYAGSDLVCYRSAGPERLVAEQSRAWDPVVVWSAEALGARFILAEGVMHASQPQAALDAVRSEVEEVRSPFALAALHVMTTLAGSVLIPLAHVRGALSADAAWAAAHVDELYQETVWGTDEEAVHRRATRARDFMAASNIFDYISN